MAMGRRVIGISRVGACDGVRALELGEMWRRNLRRDDHDFTCVRDVLRAANAQRAANAASRGVRWVQRGASA